jgi:hypothetical protein
MLREIERQAGELLSLAQLRQSRQQHRACRGRRHRQPQSRIHMSYGVRSLSPYQAQKGDCFGSRLFLLLEDLDLLDQ